MKIASGPSISEKKKNNENCLKRASVSVLWMEQVKVQ